MRRILKNFVLANSNLIVFQREYLSKRTAMIFLINYNFNYS